MVAQQRRSRWIGRGRRHPHGRLRNRSSCYTLLCTGMAGDGRRRYQGKLATKRELCGGKSSDKIFRLKLMETGTGFCRTSRRLWKSEQSEGGWILRACSGYPGTMYVCMMNRYVSSMICILCILRSDAATFFGSGSHPSTTNNRCMTHCDHSRTTSVCWT